jgi:hypothetical protein
MYERKYEKVFSEKLDLKMNWFFLGFSKHIQPTIEQNLKEIEADDLLLKRKKSKLIFLFSN